MMFKVGDRVVLTVRQPILVEENEVLFQNTLYPTIFGKIIDAKVGERGKILELAEENCRVIFEFGIANLEYSSIITEELYNSPLAKAMREENEV